MDEALLGHIFSNLLSNAVKYSPAGGTVWFNLLCQNGIAQFQIRDEGIGIPLNDQKHLFDTFHRASNVGQIKGTGLGLSIVKKCVELHRGQIRVESEVGVGTTFIVTLPANQPARLVTL
jgi:signal transduction histidine kinase